MTQKLLDGACIENHKGWDIIERKKKESLRVQMVAILFFLILPSNIQYFDLYMWIDTGSQNRLPLLLTEIKSLVNVIYFIFLWLIHTGWIIFSNFIMTSWWNFMTSWGQSMTSRFHNRSRNLVCHPLMTFGGDFMTFQYPNRSWNKVCHHLKIS